MTSLIQIAVAVMAGLLMTRVFKKLGLNFPDVTSFLIAGILIGPYVLGKVGVTGLGFTTSEEVESLTIFNDVALGFIAFSIGNEFRLEDLKRIGKKATVIGIFQALVATAVVDVALVTIHFIGGDDVISLPVAITMGAIAAATAPAATLMVVRQYKAKGKLTDLLLPIVALDDAVGLVVFAVSFGIAQAMGSGEIDVLTVVVEPIMEIFGSVILGAVMGFILSELEKLFHSNTNRLSVAISFVFLTIAFSSLEFQIGPVKLGFSSLLVCMMLGTILCNVCSRSEDIMERSEKWTAPLYTLFFVLSGAELELKVFQNITVIMVGVVYILCRCIGKYFGAKVSAKATGCEPEIQKYLGITLFPQAGVSLGMCLTAAALGGYDAVLIRNITLFGVMVYELVGPQLTRKALTAAGEIVEKPAEKTNKRFNDTKRKWKV